MKFIPLLMFLWAIFFGCTRQVLTVQTEFLSHENLASYHVRTPDPRLWNPPYGQRLIISWHLPAHLEKQPQLQLSLRLRFYNHTEKNELIDLYKNNGIYVYSLLNEEYCETQGILTYKVELLSAGNIIEEWRHQLWVELITLNQTEEVSKEPLEEP